MKIRNPRNPNRRLFATLAAILFVILIVAGVWWWTASKSGENDINKVNYEAPSENQVEAGEGTVEQADPDAPIENDRDNEDEGPTTEQPHRPYRPTESDEGRIGITVANQDGSNLSIRTLIQGGHSDGICTLSLARGSSVAVREEAKVQMVASNYTCMGFDIDTSRLIGGEYRIDLTYRGGGQTYTATQTITLK